MAGRNLILLWAATIMGSCTHRNDVNAVNATHKLEESDQVVQCEGLFETSVFKYAHVGIKKGKGAYAAVVEYCLFKDENKKAHFGSATGSVGENAVNLDIGIIGSLDLKLQTLEAGGPMLLGSVILDGMKDDASQCKLVDCGDVDCKAVLTRCD